MKKTPEGLAAVSGGVNIQTFKLYLINKQFEGFATASRARVSPLLPFSFSPLLSFSSSPFLSSPFLPFSPS